MQLQIKNAPDDQQQIKTKNRCYITSSVYLYLSHFEQTPNE